MVHSKFIKHNEIILKYESRAQEYMDLGDLYISDSILKQINSYLAAFCHYNNDLIPID